MHETGNYVPNQSEVAHLKAQLDEERKALFQGLYGLSEGARHQIINARYRRIQDVLDDLEKHVGADEAMRLVNTSLDT